MEGDPDPQMSNCFLCLNSFKVSKTDLNGCHGDVKSGNGTGGISHKFLKFTENQLGLPLKDFFLDVDQFGNAFCGECNNVVCIICSLYDDLCSVQARLKEEVDQLLDLLERSSNKKYNDSGSSAKVDVGIRGKCHFKEVVEKRSQLKQHCKRYCQSTGKSSCEEVEGIHQDVQLDDDEERVDVKSELDCLTGDEGEEDCSSLQNEMETVTEVYENGSDASSVLHAESPGSPAAAAEDVSTNNSDSDWKGESETENDDESETDAEDNSFEDKKPDKKTKKEPPKTKTVKNVRSTKKETNLNDNLGESIYKCDKCGKPYISKGYLDKHLRRVHGLGKRGQVTCDLCGKEFSQKSSLMRHKDSQHNGKIKTEDPISHNCTKCEQSFQRRGCLDKHMFKIHGIGSIQSYIYNCNLCGKGFNLKGSLNRHLRESHKKAPTKTETPYFCKTCQIFFKTSKSSREHNKRAHEDGTNQPSTSTPPPDKPFKCEICSYQLTTHSALVHHVNKKHGIERKLVSKPVNCTISMETCKDKYSLERHVNLVHQSKMEVGCPKCSMKFATRRQLIHHKYTVHKKDDIQVSFMKRLESAKGNLNDEVKENCVVCNEEFSSWEVLRGHLKIHEEEISINEKTLRCFKCDKLFAYGQTIWAHLRSSKRHDYTSIEFPCDHGDHLGYSQWVFRSPNLLEKHFKEEHPNSLVLKCEQCGWPFLDKNMLDLHRLLHIPRIDSKYQCPVCSNTFLNQDSLQGHYNPVHGVSLKLFRCDVCTWGFATKRGLAGHAKTHEKTVVHDFLCSQCPRSFKTAIQLRDHSRQLHVSKQCPDCGIVVQRSKYSRHRKMKHGQSQPGLLCTLCGMAFRDGGSLRNHMAFHGEYHFKCQYCGKGCVSGWYLRKHIRKDHKDQIGNEGAK